MIAARQRRQPEPETTAPGAPERPTLRSIAPEWAALSDKFAELSEREAEIVAELAIIVPVLRDNGAFANIIPAPPASPPPKPDGKVVQLLGRLMPERKQPDRGPPETNGLAFQEFCKAWIEAQQLWKKVRVAAAQAQPDKRAAIVSPAREAQDKADALGAKLGLSNPIAGMKLRADELSDELATVREAKQLLIEPVREANLHGSAALCKALSVEYQLVADRVCNAILELGEAAIAHEEWLAELRQQGASFSMLKPVLVRGWDDHVDPIAKYRRLLQWAADAGWFDAARIPEAWRKRS